MFAAELLAMLEAKEKWGESGESVGAFMRGGFRRRERRYVEVEMEENMRSLIRDLKISVQELSVEVGKCRQERLKRLKNKRKRSLKIKEG